MPDPTSGSHSLKARLFYGVWSPALTPVDEDLAPDPQRFEKHTRWLLANGCHRVVVFGTTGEAPSFSVHERMRFLEGTLEAGIPSERLAVGTGCAALTDSVRLTRHAADRGCHTVLVLPPFYFKGPPEEGLYRSFAEIIERAGASELRVILYHFPKMSSVPITPGLLRRLRDAYPRQIVGLKDSSGNWKETATFLSEFPDLCIFPGSEEFLLRGLMEGGVGCISASANVNPRPIRAVLDAWLRGSDDVEVLQEGINAVRLLLEAQPLIPALKHIVAHYRNDPGWRRLRPPLTPLHAAAGDELLSGLARTGFRLDLQ